MSSIVRDPGRSSMPPRAGTGLKPTHYRTILESLPAVGFFEVHAENYMGAGGPPHRYLSAIAAHYPLSLHGVGLSIGGQQPLDRDHLRKLKLLIDRYRPALFSEHLAWSTHQSSFFHDLLPLPYTQNTLVRVAEHIDEVQNALSRQMLLENPSTYLRFEQSTYAEQDFIAELAQRTGCGLLLDVNNVFVASVNQQWDPFAYVNAFPLDRVQQIHLAGNAPDQDEFGQALRIDTHDRPVCQAVWKLYEHALLRIGPVPTLIEWDADVPAWPVLESEVNRADALLRAVQCAEAGHAVA